MFPPAPVLFSTTMGWPHLVVSLSAAMRASTSLMPPPGNGTTNLTGLAGNPDGTCPRAGNAVAAKIANTPRALTPIRMQRSRLRPSRIRVALLDAMVERTGLDGIVRIACHAGKPQRLCDVSGSTWALGRIL